MAKIYKGSIVAFRVSHEMYAAKPEQKGTIQEAEVEGFDRRNTENPINILFNGYRCCIAPNEITKIIKQ